MRHGDFGQRNGRAGVRDRAAEVLVLDLDREAAGDEVLVLERLLGATRPRRTARPRVLRADEELVGVRCAAMNTSASRPAPKISAVSGSSPISAIETPPRSTREVEEHVSGNSSRNPSSSSQSTQAREVLRADAAGSRWSRSGRRRTAPGSACVIGASACRPVWRCTVFLRDQPVVGAALGGDVGGRVHAHVDELARAR